MASRDLRVTLLGEDRTAGAFASARANMSKLGQQFEAASVRAQNSSRLLSSALTGPGGLAVLALGAAGALSPLAGAVAVLPGMFAAGAVAVKTFTVGMSGFGAALASTGDPTKFAVALQKLAPAAAQAAVAVRDLRPSFSALQLSVQDALFAGLAQRITSLGGTYVPRLQASMTGLATGLNLIAQRFADFLAESATVRDIQSIFERTRQAVTNLAGAVQPLMQALRDVALVGTGFLPDMASGAANASVKFAEFIAQVRQSGALQDFMATGLQAVRDLAVVLKAVAEGATGALGPFALMRGALSFLADNAGAVTAVMQVALPVLMAYKVALLAAGIAQAGMAAASFALLIPSMVAVAAKTAFAAAAVVAGWVSMAASAAVSAATVAAGWVMMGVQAMASAARIALAWLIAIGPIALVVAAVAGVVFLIVKNWDTITAATAAAWNAVVGWVTGAWTAITGAVSTAVRAVADFVSAGWDAIRSGTVAAWNAVSGAISATWNWITSAVSVAANAVKAVVVAVFDAVKAYVQTVATAWRTIIEGVWLAITTFVGAAVTGVKTVIQVVWSGIQAIISGYVNAWRAVIETVWGAVTAIVSGVVAGVKAAIGGLGAIVGTVGGFFRGALAAAAGALGDLVGLVGGIPGRVIGALGDLGRLLFGAGRSVVQGLIDGIKSMIGAIGAAMSSVVSKAKGFLPFSPAKEGPFAGRGSPYNSGRSVAQMWAAGLADGQGVVAAGARALVDGADLLGAQVGGTRFILDRITRTAADPAVLSPPSGDNAAILAELQALRAEIRRQTDRHVQLTRSGAL